MRRRTFLLGISGFCVALSGCAAINDNSTSETAEQTDTGQSSEGGSNQGSIETDGSTGFRWSSE